MSYTLTLERSEYSVTWLSPQRLVTTNVEADLKNNSSRGKAGPRVLARFLIALCIAIAAILAWQPYSDAAREVIASSSPQGGWLAAPAAPIAHAATDVNTPASLSPDQRQPEAMPLGIAAVQQSLDPITPAQEQMTRDVSRLEVTERHVLYKMSDPPRRPAPAQARKRGSRAAPKMTGAGLNTHYAATSSMSFGSSSPLPVLLMHRDAGHMRTQSSAAGLRGSVSAAQFNQALKSILSRITGIRS